jgi:hypothetical protein
LKKSIHPKLQGAPRGEYIFDEFCGYLAKASNTCRVEDRQKARKCIAAGLASSTTFGYYNRQTLHFLQGGGLCICYNGI